MWRALVSFALAALALAGCSGSSSSSFFPPSEAAGGLPAGSMSVKLSAAGELDFSGAQYTVVFNTSGDGRTPSGDPHGSDWNAYSYALVAGGTGTSTAMPASYLRASAGAPALHPLVATPGQFAFDPNLDGLGREYAIVFSRALFGRAAGPAVRNVWRFNAFAGKPNPSDARLSPMGSLGSCRTCFASPALDVTKRFDIVEYVKVPWGGNPSAEIVRVEIANNP